MSAWCGGPEKIPTDILSFVRYTITGHNYQFSTPLPAFRCVLMSEHQVDGCVYCLQFMIAVDGVAVNREGPRPRRTYRHHACTSAVHRHIDVVYGKRKPTAHAQRRNGARDKVPIVVIHRRLLTSRGLFHGEVFYTL